MSEFKDYKKPFDSEKFSGVGGVALFSVIVFGQGGGSGYLYSGLQEALEAALHFADTCPLEKKVSLSYRVVIFEGDSFRLDYNYSTRAIDIYKEGSLEYKDFKTLYKELSLKMRHGWERE